MAPNSFKGGLNLVSVTNYYSVGGSLLGEATSGNETTYMLNALGSAIGTITGAGVRNRYIYSPYGRQTSKSGSDPDPSFEWNGSSGYRQTSRDHAPCYVRLRHLGTSEGRWTSVDPIWPTDSAYVYATNR